jgi:WD40 repeat protein
MNDATSARKPRGRRQRAIVLVLVAVAALAGGLWHWPRRPRAVLQGEHEYGSMCFSPDGHTLALEEKGHLEEERQSKADPTFQLADVATGRVRATLRGRMGRSRWSWDDGLAQRFHFSPDSRLLLVKGFIDGRIHLSLSDVQTGELLVSLQLPEWCERVSYTFSPDGRFLLYQQRQGDHPDEGKPPVTRLWDTVAGRERSTLPKDVTAWAFAADGQTLATWQRRIGKVVFWRLSGDRGPLQRAKKFSVGARDAAWSPDLRLVVFGTFDYLEQAKEPTPGDAWIQDVTTGEKHRLAGPDDHGPLPGDGAPSFSADGKHLLVPARPDGVLWDMSRFPPRKVCTVPYRARLSPDWQLLTVLTQTTRVELREVGQAQPRVTLSIPDSTTFQVERGVETPFSPDGTIIAVAGSEPGSAEEKSVMDRFRRLLGLEESKSRISVGRLWSTGSGRQLQSFPDCVALAFSPDGGTLATLQEDGTVRLWDMPPQPLPGRIICWAVFGCIVAFVAGHRLLRRRRGRAQAAAPAG